MSAEVRRAETITVVFADLVGFTERAERLDPDLIRTHARHDLHRDQRLVCERDPEHVA
jgi:class 3 adenylate cyclase